MMKDKSKIKIFFLSLLLPLCLFPKTVEASISLAQQIEIFRQEILVLRSLLLNLQSTQEITAQAYLALRISDNSIILEKNSNQAYPIASITKLMSAVVGLENIEEKKNITLTEKMLGPLGQSPSLFLGLNISAENLLKASLIQSSNDASEALSFFVGKENFVCLMNQKAKEIKMTNTFFQDAHGLSLANKSTAADLAKLLIYIDENHQEILNTTKDNNFWLPDSTGKLLKFQNINNFYPLSAFVGGKTGYLPEVRQTLASIFEVNGEKFAIVLLSSDNRQADAFSIIKQLSN